MAAAAIRFPTSTDCQATACSTGSAKNAEKSTNPNSKMTKSSTTPKPKSGLRSATATNRAAASPMSKNASTCTHVNDRTSSSDGESCAGAESPPVPRNSAVARTVGV